MQILRLQKLSFYICLASQTFESRPIKILEALLNLVEINIDYSHDFVELPPELCKITTLKTLSITNCHDLSALPEEIGKLENLEMLRLSSCSDLVVMPESFASLHNLLCLDISDYIRLNQLPEDIGNLISLEKLYMWGCTSLSELPYSIMKFGDLEHAIHVICDREVAALWERFRNLPNLKIETIKADINLKWLEKCKCLKHHCVNLECVGMEHFKEVKYCGQLFVCPAQGGQSLRSGMEPCSMQGGPGPALGFFFFFLNIYIVTIKLLALNVIDGK